MIGGSAQPASRGLPCVPLASPSLPPCSSRSSPRPSPDRNDLTPESTRRPISRPAPTSQCATASSCTSRSSSPRRRDGAAPVPVHRERRTASASRRRDSPASYKDLAEDGYIFVFQDIRGRYKSEGTFVMQRPPQPVDAPRQAIDESTDTYDTIDWMLDEHPEQQRPRRHAGRELRRLDRGDGHARRPPRAQGGESAGVAGRHVPRRRLPPQRRVPAELRLRVRLAHRGDARELRLRLRPLRHLRVVPELGPAVEHPGEGAQGQEAADLERLRRPPELRRVLAAAGDAAVPHARHGADAQRRRLVGPGGLLRPGQDLPGARAARPARTGTSSSSARGTTAAGAAGRGRSSATSTSARRPASTSARKIQAPFFAHYLKDKGALAPARGDGVRVGQQHVAHVRHAGRRRARRRSRSTSTPNGKLSFTPPTATGGPSSFDSYVTDPAQSGARTARGRSSRRTTRGLGLVHVAARGPAVRAATGPTC